MIDKIDRPETRNPYQVGQAKETKEDQHQSRGQQDSEHKGYKQQEQNAEWDKFHSQSITIKTVKADRARIEKLLFKSVALQRGVANLVAKIAWKNGQTTDVALIRLERVEYY